MSALAGKCVVLGVTGGIAAYKAADLTSRLVQAGADLDVILTESAERFITPVTFEAILHKSAYCSLWDRREKTPNHISLSERADLLVVAPATANMIAKMAHGLADDLLSCTLLATRAPILIAPAMNDNMFAHPATQANLQTLQARGVSTIGPEEGRLVSGKVGGKGRMSEPAAIVESIEALLA